MRDLEVFAGTLSRAKDDVHGFGDALLPWLHRRHGLALAAALSDIRSPRGDLLRRSLDNPARLQWTGAGSSRPKYPETSAESRARNRRVEIVHLRDV